MSLTTTLDFCGLNYGSFYTSFGITSIVHQRAGALRISARVVPG